MCKIIDFFHSPVSKFIYNTSGISSAAKSHYDLRLPRGVHRHGGYHEQFEYRTRKDRNGLRGKGPSSEEKRRIDEVAGACASRHTGLPVTTASIDNLTFKRGAYLADRLVLLGRMTYVGNTSCEVRVDTFIEDKEGYRHIINRAFLTYVAIDEAGRPLPIPYGLEVKTVAEQARWDGALLRRNNRKARQSDGF